MMTEVTYTNLALEWAPENNRDSFFNRLTVVVVILTIIFGVVMMSVQLPKVERVARTDSPTTMGSSVPLSRSYIQTP